MAPGGAASRSLLLKRLRAPLSSHERMTHGWVAKTSPAKSLGGMSAITHFRSQFDYSTHSGAVNDRKTQKNFQE